MTGPRFSVVVPTRDRPDLLAFCLQGLASQTFADIEVVVSDNPSRLPAEDVFERFARAGWRYLRHEDDLAMHDNFEAGCLEARGEFVSVVIDKTVLHPSALELADRALQDQPAEIVTWRNEGYDPVDESLDVGRGRFQARAETAQPALYDPAAELIRRFSNAERRGADPIHYFRGKIVFGAYSRGLLERIRQQTGRIFYPLAADYTSMVPACVLARSALDLGRPLLVSYNSSRSNGRRQSLEPEYARRFIESVDPGIIESLPIPGLYTSHHNVVAYDLVSSASRCPAGSTPSLDLVNLARRAREDLADVVWPSEAGRADQYAILEEQESQLGVVPQPLKDERRGPFRDRVARLLALRRSSRPQEYASPLDAARAAERLYAAVSS